MLVNCLLRRSSRFLFASRRHLLSKKFALNEEWSSRHSALREIGIEGGYEWITAVQKKFASAGMASAVDVDAAICIAEELDQLDDVLRIVYKLRHNEMTGRMLPSTEYALIRLLLKHNKTAILLAILADPINYGIFLNEHSACLVIDNFLEANKITDAARVASHVMLQEMFQSTLLNWLCIYVSLRWTELPSEQRLFAELPSLDYVAGIESSTGNMEDEDELTFKFPYLKNEHTDMHFDLTDPDQLIGKNLLWFSACVELSEEEARSVRLIGSIFFGNYVLASRLLQGTYIFSSAATVCQSKLEQLTNEADDAGKVDRRPSEGVIEELKGLINKVTKKDTEEELSVTIMKHLKAVQNTEERNLIEMQRGTFLNWKQNRADIIKAQVETLDLKLQLKETYEERRKLRDVWEMLNFFENRLKWEDMAAVKEKLLKAEQGKRKSKEDLEREYVDEVLYKKSAKYRIPKFSYIIWCYDFFRMLNHTEISVQDVELNGIKGTSNALSDTFSVAERLTESAHIVDHDPSLAIYRLHEHIGKTLSVLVTRKYTMANVNSRLQGACFDMDNVLSTVQSMEKAAPSFENIQIMLRDCLNTQQVNCTTK